MADLAFQDKDIQRDPEFVSMQTLKIHTAADRAAAPEEEVQVLQMVAKHIEAALEMTWW
jgi:hypothetical protein